MTRRTVYARLFQLARPYLETRHNHLHTRVSVRFACRLLEQEGGDPQIAVPAVVLHDVGWSCVPEALQLSAFGPNMSQPQWRDVHEREGARLARDILVEVGYPRDKISAISEIISRHDSQLHADSLEEAIVKDADKLWRYSREGFGIDVERFGTTAGEHLARLEASLATWFLTAGGQQSARAELQQRRREYEGCA